MAAASMMFSIQARSGAIFPLRLPVSAPTMIQRAPPKLPRPASRLPLMGSMLKNVLKVTLGVKAMSPAFVTVVPYQKFGQSVIRGSFPAFARAAYRSGYLVKNM